MGLVTEYPAWFIILCLLIGGIYAFALYFRAGRDTVPTWILRLLTVFRFLAVFIIAFLLLSPMIRRKVTFVEKPVIIIGQDNSTSLAMGKDSAYMKTNYPAKLNEFIKKLEGKYEVHTFLFDDKVRIGQRPDFSGKMTDISAFTDELKTRYSNRNVGAVIIATDGIYNKGVNPYYSCEDISFPIYAIALGDTAVQRDVMIRKCNYNREVFMGDNFPVEVQVDASKCAGENVKVTISKGSQVMGSQDVPVQGDHFSKKVTFLLEAKEKGIQRYTVSVTPVKNDFYKGNNYQEIYVDVRDSREKIAILYDSPHPDISALAQALTSGLRYEVSEFRLSDFKDEPGAYDLIILYQVPSLVSAASIDKITKSETSLLYILGTQSDLNTFNKLNAGLTITGTKISWSEVFPLLNNSFALFTLDKQDELFFQDDPPLLAPYGNYQSNPLADVMVYQKIGSVATQFPLIMFYQDASRKTGIIAGENLWRWRLSDYIHSGNHDTFDKLIHKIVQFLAIKGDKSFFRVRIDGRFLETDPVQADAELYNESYELINQPDVSMVITDENNKSFPFGFNKTGNGYFLNAGNFPVGNYTYKATVKVGNKQFEKSGNFLVAPVNIEATSIIADHALLYRITHSHDGMVAGVNGMDSLVSKILERKDIHSVSFSQKRYSELISTPWIFILILLLLSFEWAIRKRSGM